MFVMKPKGLYSCRNTACLKYMQLSTFRQMNQLAMEAKNPPTVIYLKTILARQGFVFWLLFFWGFFWCFGWVFFPSSLQALAPINYPPENLNQLVAIPYLASIYKIFFDITHSLKAPINPQNSIL